MIFTLIGQALVGWLLADLLGGIVHWWEDRIGRPSNRWIERHVLEPNRLHHDEPLAFTKTGFWYRNSTTLIAAAIPAALWLWLGGPSVVLLFAFVGGAFQNEIHYWTHMPRSGVVRVLQQIGIIQSVAGHARHHKPPQNRNYCVLTDWLNPLLEHFSVWHRLERRLGITDSLT